MAQSRPLRRRRRLVLRVMSALLLLVLVTAGGGLVWLRGSLPQVAGTVVVDGSAAPITIERDPDGVPHIRASTADDALFGPIFSRHIANGGDASTVNVGPVRASELYTQYHIPSYRQIVDLGDPDASRFMIAPGQSGNVLSGDYDALLERWQRVDYLPMRFTREALDGVESRRLELRPGTAD
jgi:acyl-homoserine lactone acylase PvdQ